MAGITKPTRLGKIVKEFNLGMESIADFLKEKGFEIDPRPTSKVTPEMYQHLLDEFAKDRDLKERAEQITIGNKERKKIEVGEKGSINVIEIRRKEEEAKKAAEQLEAEALKVEEKPVEEEVVVEQVQPEEPVVPVVEEKKPAEPVKEVEVVEEKIVEEKTVAPEPVAEKQEEEKPAPVVETPELKEVEPKPVKQEEKPAEEPKPAEPIKDNAGPKVLGKIDLDSLKQNKKKGKPKKTEAPAPKKQVPKSNKKQKPVEPKRQPKKEEKQQQPKPVAKKQEPVIDFKKTEKISLTGPKVLGKIELPVSEPKKKDKKTGQQGDGQKRKRKRITSAQPKRVNVAKAGRNFDNKRGNRRGGGNKRNQKDEQQVVSEKAIQDQIKATMAKLSGGGGKKHRQRIRRSKRNEMAETRAIQEELDATPNNLLEVTEFISVSELASLMDVGATEVITTCMSLGTFVSINQRLDAELIELVADEFNFEVKFIDLAAEDDEEDEIVDAPEDLEERSPIVTIMGHVDHGKTSLLDYIRNANVIAGEVGGITQHIGAYEVTTESGKRITFLDTPGHEAFTAMRARGAKITDIAVIVIAADDAVMPQTKEAISHAQAAGVPMIFAFNKIDKEGANADRIREQLSGMNILVEEWGGKFQSQEISAKQGTNIDDLLEKILLEAELLELKANPNRNAVGSILEASLDKGRGFVANVLVQTGSLEVGDVVLSGAHYGRVKAMFDERGKQIEKAGPSTPILMLGLNGAPQAGEKIKKFDTEQEAKELGSRREQILREQGRRTKKHITLDEIGRRLALDNFQELNLIVKGDVDGSVEALSDSLLKLSTEEIQVNVIHKSVGQISESDVLLATASDAIIVGFQVRPSGQARKLAEKEDIDIRMYSIIYDAIDEIKSAMEGLLKPKIEEKVVCMIEIRDVFKISKVGTIAGCYVKEGKVNRNTKVRLIRDGIVKYTGELASLKRFKDDVKEVASGYECGLNIKNYNDIKVGDMIEGYEEVEVARKL